METFENFSIGNLQLKNRLMMAPVKTAYATAEGKTTPRLIEYYKRRADGGIGAIIVESMIVDPMGREHPKQMSIISDDHIEGLKTLTSALHEKKTHAVAHLNHGGRAANPKVIGAIPEAPSAIECPTTGAIPDVIDKARIKEVVFAFGEAARRAEEAGFDAIEIQFGLGYLIQQFYSEKTNLRTDEYGGSQDNRLRFASEVLYSVRSRINNNMPLIARISASLDGSDSDMENSIVLVKWLENNGINAIHVVSGSACDSPPWYYQHMRLPANKNLEWAKKIKREVDIPVIVAGRMGDPDMITEELATNSIDAVALGRPLVVDPDFPNKMKKQTPDTIVQCGACMQGCLVGVKTGIGLGCIANPEVGLEYESTPDLETPHKVVVIGGGPAGIQAALTSAKRGHQVTLFEKEMLGGQYRMAILPPGKDEMQNPLNGMIAQLRHKNIEVHTGVLADIETISAEKPDHVIIATGSSTNIPNIPGLKKYLVAEDVFYGKSEVGNSVLVIGGGMIGIETAEYLTSRGHEVTVVEILDEFAQDMEPITRKLLLKHLTTTSAKLLNSTSITRIQDNSVFIQENRSEILLGEFDSIVIATGVKPQNTLAKKLDTSNIPYTLIGDAKQPGNIVKAVLDGYKTLSQL